MNEVEQIEKLFKSIKPEVRDAALVNLMNKKGD